MPPGAKRASGVVFTHPARLPAAVVAAPAGVHASPAVGPARDLIRCLDDETARVARVPPGHDVPPARGRAALAVPPGPALPVGGTLRTYGIDSLYSSGGDVAVLELASGSSRTKGWPR